MPKLDINQEIALPRDEPEPETTGPEEYLVSRALEQQLEPFRRHYQTALTDLNKAVEIALAALGVEGDYTAELVGDPLRIRVKRLD